MYREMKTAGRILLIPIEDVLPCRVSLRSSFSPAGLCALTDSVRRFGLLSPLTVCSAGGGKYTVVSGERRRRAALLAGLEYLPCMLIHADGISELIFSLCENINREPLHYFDEAAAVSCLFKLLTVPEIASELGLPERRVLALLRLNAFPEEIKARLISGGADEKTALRLREKMNNTEQINTVLDIMARENCGVDTALKSFSCRKAKKTSGFFSGLTVFTNTIEKAVRTMTEAGIGAEMLKTESTKEIEYTIKIVKLKAREAETTAPQPPTKQQYCTK